MSNALTGEGSAGAFRRNNRSVRPGTLATARKANVPSEIMKFRTTFLALLLAGCAAHPPDSPECAVCPQMRTIPAGTALLGSGDDDPLGRPDERPQRSVTIVKPFEVSTFEVTRAQYAAFVRATGYPAGANCLTDRAKRGDWVYDANTTWLDPGFAQGDAHPVACVSYDDARAYVAWLNTRTHGGYRLPTELEWEYAARAGAATTWPWGDDPAAGCATANGFDQTTLAVYSGVDTSGYPRFDPLPCSDGWLNTHPVGALAANAFGVHDMIGNVSEWVDDCYAPSRAAAAAAPTPGPCARRIAKGGSWGTLAHNLRTAERFPYAASHRDDSIGIRVARDP
jgi:formylglycine-generating enzyme